VGRLGDEGPADEIFEILRHRPPSISPRTLLLSTEGVAQSRERPGLCLGNRRDLKTTRSPPLSARG
jgi:hypothetical protein